MKVYPTNKLRFIPTTGTFPLGFIAGGMNSGVKENNFDISLVVSPNHHCNAAAVFTTNKFCAAPVVVSKQLLKNGGLYGVVINSGCANAGTGKSGIEDAKRMATVFKKPCLVMSTGVIGQPLKINKIITGLHQLHKNAGSDFKSWMNATEGIMTTDAFPKMKTKEFVTRSGEKYRVAGWCKGAGMIHPNMATMLGGIFTDAKIGQSCLEKSTKFAADRSFNAISVDGDTSTNDTFVVFANGAATMKQIAPDSADFKDFQENLTNFAIELAQLIVRDGEGATKMIEVKVKGAHHLNDAKIVANAVATSALVKTAIYGKDANWGRIICAVGYSGVNINPDRVNLHMRPQKKSAPSLHLFKDGGPFQVDEKIASEILEHEDITLEIDLGMGPAEHTIYTCDLTHEYISINADYRS